MRINNAMCISQVKFYSVKIINRTVLVLSLVSLFADVASEMLYPIIPVYLKEIGFSVLLIGVLEGIANFTSALTKGYFGKWSDEKGVVVTISVLGRESIEFPAGMLGQTREVKGLRKDKSEFPAEISRSSDFTSAKGISA